MGNETEEMVLFKEFGIVNVDNYDAMSPSDSLGYLSGGTTSIFQDGNIEIVTGEETMSFSAKDIKTKFKRDLFGKVGIVLTLENRGLTLSFGDDTEKAEQLWNTLKIFDECKESIPAKRKHITNEQLMQLVGKQLFVKLWFNEMMNELRRYPNEIPCEQGEIPSMRIPFASGDEKVEWGFIAGMSCLTQNPDGSILVQNVEHFPACAVLALLSLLYDAGAAEGKKISVTLQIPDSPQLREFNSLLAEVETTLKNTKITRITVQRLSEKKPEAGRTVLPFGGSWAAVQNLNQTDIGRFVAQVKCALESFRVGDDLTVVDGKFRVLQEHCPITQIVSLKNQAVQCSDDLDEDVFYICFAMWFPPDSPPITGLNLLKEKDAPAFTPKTMPTPIVIRALEDFDSDRMPESAPQEPKKKDSFFRRLFRQNSPK